MLATMQLPAASRQMPLGHAAQIAVKNPSSRRGRMRAIRPRASAREHGPVVQGHDAFRPEGFRRRSSFTWDKSKWVMRSSRSGGRAGAAPAPLNMQGERIPPRLAAGSFNGNFSLL